MNPHSERLTAKCCYRHLGGILGERLFERMVALEWFRRDETDSKRYPLTRLGEEEFLKLGVDPYEVR